MNTTVRVGALVAALILTVPLPAQTAASISTGAVADVTKSLTDARKLRADMVDNILNGSEKPPAAIARLRALDSPSGLPIDHDTDFAFAAIDIGLRLLPPGKAAEAEQFFHEAEKSLVLVLNKTPDTQAHDKAELLKHLAFIRGRFLGNPAQARLDIEQAITLQPDDKNLQDVRQNLARENAESFKDQPKSS
jgi:hypothetical protein